MPKDQCISCDGQKDIRAKRCNSCRFIHAHPRKGTGKGWYVDTTSGYVVGFMDGKYVYQHRYFMEKSLGRKLMTQEHVHHKDHSKSNNDLSNLVVVSAAEHHRLHIMGHRFEMSAAGHLARWGYVSNL